MWPKPNLPKIAAACTAVLLSLVFVADPAMAQIKSSGSSYSSYGDVGAIMGALRLIFSIVATLVPFGLLCFWTYRMRPKDLYDVGWIVLAWTAYLFVIR